MPSPFKTPLPPFTPPMPFPLFPMPDMGHLPCIVPIPPIPLSVNHACASISIYTSQLVILL